MNGTIEFVVFNDKNGNRFVFPGVFVSEERSFDWEQCFMYELILGIKREKERLTATVVDGEIKDFSHVVADVTHPGFAHGGTTVYLISGPMFDEASGA